MVLEVRYREEDTHVFLGDKRERDKGRREVKEEESLGGTEGIQRNSEMESLYLSKTGSQVLGGV